MIVEFFIVVAIMISFVVGSYVGMKLTTWRLHKDFHVISGKDADRLYKKINDKEVSDEHKEFIKDCLGLLNEYEEIK